MTIQELIALFARYRHRTNDVEITQMCGLGASATTAKLKTVNPIVFFLYNQQISFPATAAITMTTCDEQPVSSFCYYLVSVSLTSAITITKGTNNAYALPLTPAGTTPVGALRVDTNDSTTFTSGTTSLTATGITARFYDIDCGITIRLINQAQQRLERGVTIVRKGSQRTIMDFDYMQIRASVDLVQGDSTVVLPFPNFKDFVNEGVNITDSIGIRTRLYKEDSLPLGVTDLQVRPIKISARVMADPSYYSMLEGTSGSILLEEGGYVLMETVLTDDGFPGMEFILWPECDQAYTLDVQAYQYSPALDGVLYSRNWLTENASDILLFGALSESGAYFGYDSQIKEWEARWQEAVWTLYSSQEKSKYSGSHIFTKFPDPLRNKTNIGISSSSQGIMSYGFFTS
jgi:hypothetical protein